MLSTRAGLIAGIVAVVVALSGCTPDPLPTGEVSVPPTRSSTFSPPSDRSSTEKPPQNDLSKGALERTLKSGGIEVKIKYSSRLPIDQWSVGAAKPLNISASATMSNGSRQKIYLSNVTVYIDVRDAAGALEAPDPLQDTAPITPGFLFTAPANYLQEFYIPPLSSGATAVTLRIRYEMLLQNDAGAKDPDVKDYARQTATDTLVITLAV